MRVGGGHGRGICRLMRFKLPDANPGIAQPARSTPQNPAHRRSPRQPMSAPATQFKEDARRMTGDLTHRHLIQTAIGKYEVQRDDKKSRFQDWQGARKLAEATKREAI